MDNATPLTEDTDAAFDRRARLTLILTHIPGADWGNPDILEFLATFYGVPEWIRIESRAKELGIQYDLTRFVKSVLGQKNGQRPPPALPQADTALVPPEPTGAGLAQPATPTPYGDIFYAEWFVALHGADWRYCPLWKTWLHWVGTHWARDTDNAIMEDARHTLRTLGHRAVDTDDQPLLKHYAKSMNHHPLTRLLAQASSLPSLAIAPAALDRHPWLLNCANGTVDLRTGDLAPHARANLLTRCLAVAYDPAAACPRWESFLWRIMGGTVVADTPDDGSAVLEARAAADTRATRLIAFLQRALGYACTGDTSEECLFLFHGSGRNGKSKLLSTIHALLGAYATTADMKSFMHKDSEVVRNDLADLHAARFVCASELAEGSRLAEGLIKQMTGGDAIKARFLFQEYFEFLPEFKLFLAFNHKPNIRGTEEAIWSRINLVPFTVMITPEEQDKHLGEKLIEELPGILWWCIRGCLAWQADGLAPPAEVKDATQGWRLESDHVAQFLEECLLSPSVRTKASELYTIYAEWCRNTGEKEVSQMKFGLELSAKGYDVFKSHGTKWRIGIGIKDT
jgi:putative DNA primase/helicase